MDWMGDDIYDEHLEAKRIKKEQRQARKQKKAAERAQMRNSQSLVQVIMSWFRRSKKDPEVEKEKAVPGDCLGGESHPVHEEKSSQPQDPFVMPPRQYGSPELIYPAAEVDPVDSPWLKECGMVKVGTGVDTRIVPKSSIAKGDKDL
jgi:hypothetical protein